eukprot:3613275-Rhodomonas_salina.1
MRKFGAFNTKEECKLILSFTQHEQRFRKTGISPVFGSNTAELSPSSSACGIFLLEKIVLASAPSLLSSPTPHG